MKNKLRRIAAMLLSLIMTISMVGGNVLTVVCFGRNLCGNRNGNGC